MIAHIYLTRVCMYACMQHLRVDQEGKENLDLKRIGLTARLIDPPRTVVYIVKRLKQYVARLGRTASLSKHAAIGSDWTILWKVSELNMNAE